MRVWKSVLIFVAGAACGSVGTYFGTKKYFEAKADEIVSNPEDADLIIACYDADGRTISCLLPPDGADSAELPTGTEHVKLFLVDSETFMPLCRAVSQ